MRNIKFIDEVFSTNSHAKENLGKMKHFEAIAARLQTAGHGQFERVWYSSNKNGGNCYLTIVLKPKILTNLPLLTQFASLKVAQVLKTYNLSPTFKFPNDVLIDGKKIAGILAEGVFVGDKLKGVALGFGVNLNLDEDEIKNIDIPATSIFLETRKNVDSEEFIFNLFDLFKRDFENFLIHEEKGEILCYQN